MSEASSIRPARAADHLQLVGLPPDNSVSERAIDRAASWALGRLAADPGRMLVLEYAGPHLLAALAAWIPERGCWMVPGANGIYVRPHSAEVGAILRGRLAAVWVTTRTE